MSCSNGGMCVFAIQEQYRYLYELAARHLASSKQQNSQDGPTYVNSSMLWESARHLCIFDSNYESVIFNDDHNDMPRRLALTGGSLRP